jgi:parvulin-like peptidyl-prolyl isomerase
VLKVGDASVTQREFEGFIQGIGPQARRNLASQGRRPLDEYILLVILSQEALNHHLDSTPAFQETVALQRRQLLAIAEYQEIVRQSPVTPEEISSYFAAHQSEFEEAKIYQVVVRKKPEGAKEGTPGFTAEEAKSRAEEIRKALSSGDDPKKVAEKYQLPNVVRVDAEPEIVRRKQMRPDMDKAAFELKPGQVSEVFDLGTSLAFIQVVSHQVEELKDVSSRILGILQQQKINSAMEALKKKANVWMDEAYFAAPSQAGQQGATKPRVVPEGPATPK